MLIVVHFSLKVIRAYDCIAGATSKVAMQWVLQYLIDAAKDMEDKSFDATDWVLVENRWNGSTESNTIGKRRMRAAVDNINSASIYRQR